MLQCKRPDRREVRRAHGALGPRRVISRRLLGKYQHTEQIDLRPRADVRILMSDCAFATLAGTYSLVFGQPIFCFLKRERELGARDAGGHA